MSTPVRFVAFRDVVAVDADDVATLATCTTYLDAALMILSPQTSINPELTERGDSFAQRSRSISSSS